MEDEYNINPNQPMLSMSPYHVDENCMIIDEDASDKLESFISNYNKNNPGKSADCHNIYHLVAEDRDGNIVDEAFGMNVMTDEGFRIKHQESRDTYANPYYIYIGDGEFEGEPDPAQTTLVHSLGKAATYTSANWTHMHNRWNPDIHCNISQFRACQGYYGYTVWDADKTVTEIGLTARNDTSTMLFHAAIYDSNGNRITFTKKVNQKLTITVYVRGVFPVERIVNESWDRGVPCVIRTAFDPFPRYYVDYWRNMYWFTVPYDWSNKWYGSSEFRSYNRGAIENHIYTDSVTGSINILLEGRYQYISEVIFSTYYSAYHGTWVDSTSSFFVSKMKTNEPVPFETDQFRTLGYNNNSFWCTYCRKNTNSEKDPYGQLPMSNIHITSLTLYNGQTDEHDIDVPFTEPIPYLEHGYEHLRFSTREHNWITFLNEYSWYTVFLNEAPQYPIKQIVSTNRTFYVTDEYWDSSTWELVANVNNIPRDQGAKRYFIMFESEFDFMSAIDGTEYDNIRYYVDDSRLGRRVVRYDYNDEFPKLDLNNGISQDDMNFGRPTNDKYAYYSYLYTDNIYSGKSIQNETYGYIANDGFLVYVDDFSLETPEVNINNYTWDNYSKSANFTGYNHRYCLGGVDLPATPSGYGSDGGYPGMIWNTTRGEHIVVAGYKSYRKGIRLYTVNMDPAIAPTYENFMYDAEWSENPLYTHSDEGYLVIGWCAGANNQNCTYVFEYDVEDVVPNMYKVEGYHHAYAVDLTTLFVAIDSSITDHLHMVIYDMANRNVYDEFDIPSGYSFQGGAAWNDTIYVRVEQGGTYFTYVYHINQQMLELCTFNIQQMRLDTGSWYSHIQRSARANGNIESCMVLLASERDTNNENHVLFKASDPTNPIQLIRNESYQTSNFVKWQKAWLGYSADNKHLILTYAGRRCIALDISWNLKHGTTTTHLTLADLYQEKSNQFSPIYYKGYIYRMQMYYCESYDGSGSRFRSRYWRNPMEQWLPLKITGTTYTPNSMMNPVRIQGNIGTVVYRDTNRGVDEPDPYQRNTSDSDSE